MFLQITGNMPGRCDAGRIWQTRFDSFLLGFGLRKLHTDRRVFTWSSPHGAVIVHDHVDDTRITTSSPEARRLFTAAWALEFNEPLPTEELSEDFTGLRHHQISATRTEISCEGVIRRLIPLLVVFPPAGYVSESPLPVDAVRKLRDDEFPPEGAAGPMLLGESDLRLAQQMLGTVGFAATTCRPDVCFAYHLLARYVCSVRFTALVQRLLVRTARYLVLTVDLRLTVDTPLLTRRMPPGQPEATGSSSSLDLFYADVDSSHGTAPGGTVSGASC